jgi:hypothetical protein
LKVHLSPSLFSASAQSRYPFFLGSLFEVCLRRDHQVVQSPDPLATEVFDCWQSGLTRDQREMVKLVVRRSIQAESRETIESEIVASAQATDWSQTPPHIGPDDLVPLLDAPLTILVEHEVNDGAFLQAMRLGVDGVAFLKGVREKRIRFEHGGGSDMKLLIEERGKDRLRAHRMWAVFDSDALVPEHPSKESQTKISACNKAGIRYHRLQRRAIENYLPPDELKQSIPHAPANVEARRVAAAFERMSPGQRAHYNLKAGFAGDESRLAPGGKDAEHRHAVDSHFAEVQRADRDLLAKGFGKDIAPKLFSAGISEASRRRDGQEAEMVPLFRAILRWL